MDLPTEFPDSEEVLIAYQELVAAQRDRDQYLAAHAVWAAESERWNAFKKRKDEEMKRAMPKSNDSPYKLNTASKKLAEVLLRESRSFGMPSQSSQENDFNEELERFRIKESE